MGAVFSLVSCTYCAMPIEAHGCRSGNPIISEGRQATKLDLQRRSHASCSVVPRLVFAATSRDR